MPPKRTREEESAAAATPTAEQQHQTVVPDDVAPLKRLVEQLHAAKDTSEAAALLDAIARCLLQDVVIEVSDAMYRICEVEAYMLGPAHNDVYAHDNAIQHSSFQWYFHKQGESYKSGSFKGMDLALGDSKSAIGFLIRSIESIEEDKKKQKRSFEGPCVVVNHILEANKCKDIKTFVAEAAAARPAGCQDVFTCKGLRLRWASESERLPLNGDASTVLRGPRVGLVPRRAEQVPWCAVPYRFVLTNLVPGKMKCGFVAHLAATSSTTTVAECAKLVNARASVAQGWWDLCRAAYESDVP
eukprot:PhM_4_TR10949/c0_g1_i3/m.88478